MAQQEHAVTAVDAIECGQMRAFEVDGQSVLLVQDGESVHAVGAICPHAGGPLVEGVRCGDRIVCPWHKATFSLRNGAVLEPPAVDPLPRHQVRIADGQVFVRLAEVTRQKAASGDDRCFIIVGAGAAGAVAAQTLREAGFGGRVLMLDRDNRLPYDRTILSKYALSGEKGGEKSPLQSQSFYREQRIERITAEVSAIDAEARRISCTDGTTWRYDAAVLATGGLPKRPDIPGAELGNVFLLRSRTDAEAILAQAERSARAVVLGSSFIGMEVAASLRERGLDVTVIGRESVPFEKQLGREVGAAFVGLHQKRGVVLRTESRVAALEGGPDVRTVRLESGDLIPADLVVIGFGITPATAYAGSLPRAEDGSLVVDAGLRVADGLYAAGDNALFPLRGDGARIRVEHWRVAEQHGRVAALNMLGHGVSYDAVPVFWTIQYLKRLDYVGHASTWDEIVIHGDLGKPEFIAYYVKDGHVAAAAGLDRDRDMAALIELFTQRHRWDAGELGASPLEILKTLPDS
jgi:apoptosis-inducing factor 3